jgi:hypothetical protein
MFPRHDPKTARLMQRVPLADSSYLSSKAKVTGMVVVEIEIER